MKKLCLFISIALLFASCKLDVQKEHLLNRPDVQPNGNSITISGNLASTAIKYINVYRKDINEPDTIIHIGIIFPSGFNENNKTYIFYDKYALVGETYTYSCSYNEGKDGVFNTNWSEEITIPTGCGLAGGTSLNISGTLEFTYNQNTKELTQTTSITLPTYTTSSWTKNIIIQNDTSTQVFDWDDSSGQVLTSLLPSAFFDKDIKILGVIAQTTEKDADDNLQRVIWTPLLETNKITSTDSTPIIFADNTIQIITQTGSDGLDYGN